MAKISCPKNKTVTDTAGCEQCHAENKYEAYRALCARNSKAIVTPQVPITTTTPNQEDVEKEVESVPAKDDKAGVASARSRKRKR